MTFVKYTTAALVLLVATPAMAQSAFDRGFSQGWRAANPPGIQPIEPIHPIAPIPPIGQSPYEAGIVSGFQRSLRDQGLTVVPATPPYAFRPWGTE
jgi:hypothetical protein